MPASLKISFIDNPAIKSREASYTGIAVSTAKILASWRESLFSFEWLTPEGRIKTVAELPEREQIKRARIEEKLTALEPIEKPVLGIGIMDNVEIGIGRAEFLTLAAHGVRKIEVHIPKSNEADFKQFLSDIE